MGLGSVGLNQTQVDNRIDLLTYLTAEIDTLLSGKAAAVHTHAMTDVTGLTAALAGKSDTGHTHLAANITDLGTVLSGYVDIPTYNSNLTGIAASLAGKQPGDPTLTALAGYNTNGFLVQTGSDAFAGRTLTGTANRIVVTNGDGASGAPTFDVGTNVALLSGGVLVSTEFPALTGDATTVAGTLATTVVSVGGSTAANIHAAELLANAATAAPTLSTLMLRDANVNVRANMFAAGVSSFSAGTTLTVASPQQIRFTGSGAQTCVLPAANTLAVGYSYLISNEHLVSGVVTVNANGGTLVATLPIGVNARITCTNAGSAGGLWGVAYGLNPNVYSMALQPSGNVSITGGTISVGSGDFGALTMQESGGMSFGTAAGTQIGTAANQKIGHWGATPGVQPTVTGSRASGAAFVSLLTQLEARGFFVDSTSA